MSSECRKKRVVIVGGGFAGRTARRSLQSDFEVVLVDAKGYFEFVPSTLRCLVEPLHSKKVVLAQPSGTLARQVVAFDGESKRLSPMWLQRLLSPGVTFEGGERMGFDYCLLCTGSRYVRPIKPNLTLPVRGGRDGSVTSFSAQATAEHRIRELQDAAVRLATAGTIVIVGGGTVGVELAAEIVGTWKGQKQVTLITAQDCLLERMPRKAQRYALAWLQRHDVECVLGQCVVDWGKVVTTDAGRQFPADLCYKCIGFQPCTPYVPLSNGRAAPVAVNAATLQVEGYENVFACGDCSSTGEEKTAFSADLSAQLAAKNVLRHAKKQPLLQYPDDVCQGRSAIPAIACVSLYKNDAILQINEFVVTGFLAASAKGQIEFMQLAVAQEKSWAVGMWNLMELANLWISKFF